MKREKPSCVQLKHNDSKPFRCKSRKSNYIIIEPNKKKKKTNITANARRKLLPHHTYQHYYKSFKNIS